MKVTIHQPAFMPWYPFFQKMQLADKFIFLTNCQFEKNGYQNRFNIDNKWHTMSVKKGLRPINEKVYLNPDKDWQKIKSNLKQYSGTLETLDQYISENLCKTNTNIIKSIAQLLKIDTEIHYDEPTDLKGTDRLVDICLKNSATEYISGVSGANYLDLDKFYEAGIKVTFQDKSTMIHKPILEYLENNNG